MSKCKLVNALVCNFKFLIYVKYNRLISLTDVTTQPKSLDGFNMQRLCNICDILSIRLHAT